MTCLVGNSKQELQFQRELELVNSKLGVDSLDESQNHLNGIPNGIILENSIKGGKKLSKPLANSVFKQQIEEESGRMQGEREAGKVDAREDKGGEIPFKEDMIKAKKI